MKPIRFDELLALPDYNRVRDCLRPLFIHEKARRRLAAGAHLTFLFENAQTVWYQVQEMIRTEKIENAEAIRHELETYNELIPGAGELSATMLIEYVDARERDGALKRLVGLEQNVWMIVGKQRSAALFDTRQMSPDQVSSVQFVRFEVGNIGSGDFRKMCDSGNVVLEVNHPNLAIQAPITGSLADALSSDLQAG
ncbi:MAG TPA: DUF3501 family protein [Candidatus Binataceae bacterium]